MVAREEQAPSFNGMRAVVVFKPVETCLRKKNTRRGWDPCICKGKTRRREVCLCVCLGALGRGRHDRFKNVVLGARSVPFACHLYSGFA